jgi:hypothetical protein
MIYSDLEEARAIPLSARFQRYPDGLLTRRPIQQLASPAQQSVIDDAARLRMSPIVEVSRAEIPPNISQHNPHWLSTIKEGEFYRLLKELCTRWDSMKAEQIDAMLRATYEFARHKPNVSVAELRRAATSALKAKTMPIGLDGGTSDVWINRMLGMEKVHKYRFVRLHFTDPDYQLPNRLTDQFGLEL